MFQNLVLKKEESKLEYGDALGSCGKCSEELSEDQCCESYRTCDVNRMVALNAGFSQSTGDEERASVVRHHEANDERCCCCYKQADGLHCDVAHHGLVYDGLVL